MPKHKILSGIQKGEVIKSTWTMGVTDAINSNTKAINAPKEVLQKGEVLQQSAGSEIGNEVFTAGASDITSTTVTITDSNGNTHDIERIDSIVLTEATSGRTMTFNISYV